MLLDMLKNDEAIKKFVLQNIQVCSSFTRVLKLHCVG